MSAWGMPGRATRGGQDDSAAALQAMTAQLAALNDKIASLETQVADLNKKSGKAK